MPGHVNWIELPAKDTAAARTFYSGLFGWTTTEFGDDYHVIDNGPAGAIAPGTETFDHPRVYFATDDIGTSTARARDLGGTTGDIQTVPGVGRLAHCTDDQGCPFSLYQPEPRA